VCAFLGYDAALSGNPLLMFGDNVSVPSSSVKKSKKSRVSCSHYHEKLKYMYIESLYSYDLLCLFGGFHY
jgi:hypothetical protein